MWLHVYCLTMYPGCLYYLFHNVTVCSTCHFIPLSPLKGGGPSHFPLTFTSFPKLPPPFHSFPFSSTFPSTLVHSFFFPFPFFFFHLYLFLPSPYLFLPSPVPFSPFTCTFFSLHLYLFSPCFPSFLFSEFSSDSCLTINPSLSFLPSYLTSIPFSFSSYFSFIPQFTCLLSPPPSPSKP